MTDIELNPQGEVVLNVDKSIYDESVIDKVLYWWTADYVITRQNIPGTTIQTIVFSAPDPITREAFEKMRQKLSADFIDYKNRAIIAAETRDLRNILYAKAFANSDDFVEFEFKD
jgi:hypothetical protein bacD2_20666